MKRMLTKLMRTTASVRIHASGMAVLAIALLAMVLLIPGGVLRPWPTRALDEPSSSADPTHPAVSADELSYDVVVFGSEPSGVFAAVSASREGLRTLLVTPDPVLGGTMTLSWLNSMDMNYDESGELVTQGLFERFLREVGGDSFDVARAEEVLTSLAREQRTLDVVYGARLIEVVVEERRRPGPPPSDSEPVAGPRTTKRVSQLTFSADGKEITVLADYFIDGTADGDLAALAGAGYRMGRADAGRPGKMMASTLVFKLRNVDWERVRSRLESDGDPHTGASDRSAWGFFAEASAWKPTSERLFLRGLNMGRQDDGTVLVNALLIFGVDGTDPESARAARHLAAQALSDVVAHLAKSIPELAGTELAGVAPKLYVRETRHFEGMYTLKVSDLLEHRDFPDKIALGSYPIDVQASQPGEVGMVIASPGVYSIPARSLVPKGFGNLLVVDRAASYGSIAAGSARVLPVGMAVGEGAGVLVAEARKAGVDLAAAVSSRRVMKSVQERIVGYGGRLGPLPDPDPVTRHWVYPYLKDALEMGLIAGGYDNDFGLDQPLTAQRLANLINGLLRSTGLKFEPAELPTTAVLDREQASRIMLAALNAGKVADILERPLAAEHPPAAGGRGGLNGGGTNWEAVVSSGIVPRSLASRIPGGELAVADGIALAVSAYRYAKSAYGMTWSLRSFGSTTISG